MKVYGLVLITAVGLAVNAAWAQNFDRDKTGMPPAGWSCGVTGNGSPKWSVETDETAPSRPNVLIQSGKGTYPWCIREETSLNDGFVEVKFKPINGREDQAGGLVWRWKDVSSYYIARANALENNVSLYYVERGYRNTIKYVDAPVPRNQWNTLRAEFTGKRVRVTLNGKMAIEVEDEHISGKGAVGVWTKADSITAFDDFTFGTAAGNR